MSVSFIWIYIFLRSKKKAVFYSDSILVMKFFSFSLVGFINYRSIL